MPRTRIKICGITDLDAARCAGECGADAVGFVFVEDSPRAIDPDEAFDIMHALPPFLISVGVTRDLDSEDFAAIEEVCPTLYSQLHGDEPERVVRACGPDILKAVRVDSKDPGALAATIQRWAGVDEVAAILVDAPSPGEGRTFDWAVLAPCMDLVHTPIILAGGLTPDNVGEAIKLLRPWGVDVSSGVERERGVKDHELIAAFCDAVRRADARA